MTPPKITEAQAEELTARHSGEPWYRLGPFEIAQPRGSVIVRLEKHRECSSETALANGIRIVASVNACTGMADPEAEIARLRQDKAELVGATELLIIASEGVKLSRTIETMVALGDASRQAQAALANARKES